MISKYINSLVQEKNIHDIISINDLYIVNDLYLIKYRLNFTEIQKIEHKGGDYDFRLESCRNMLYLLCLNKITGFPAKIQIYDLNLVLMNTIEKTIVGDISFSEEYIISTKWARIFLYDYNFINVKNLSISDNIDKLIPYKNMFLIIPKYKENLLIDFYDLDKKISSINYSLPVKNDFIYKVSDDKVFISSPSDFSVYILSLKSPDILFNFQVSIMAIVVPSGNISPYLDNLFIVSRPNRVLRYSLKNEKINKFKKENGVAFF